MKIYTKTGDNGQTSLIGGTRVLKSDERIEAYGTVDELNSYIGMLRDQEINKNRKDILIEIQDRLFTIGASLAYDAERSKSKIPDLFESDVQLLENEMDKMDALLPAMKFFVLPGGHPSVSFSHLARTVCRRAERLVIRFNEDNKVDPLIIKYLNRLSDFIFVLGRLMSQELGAEEIPWKPRK